MGARGPPSPLQFPRRKRTQPPELLVLLVLLVLSSLFDLNLNIPNLAMFIYSVRIFENNSETDIREWRMENLIWYDKIKISSQFYNRAL